MFIIAWFDLSSAVEPHLLGAECPEFDFLFIANPKHKSPCIGRVVVFQ